MNIDIQPLDRPDFVGGARGIDISLPLTASDTTAIEAGMDRYAVLVFRGQPLTDEQQCSFSRNFGELEVTLISQMMQPSERRLGPLEMGDISNLDATGKLRSRDDNRRMYALGNRLWHSDASFRATGAGYSLLSARIVPGSGGDTEFADMRAAYDALDPATKADVEDLVAEHSIAFSRSQLGFDDYGEGNADKIRPVRHRLVRTHPVTGRKSLYLSAHIGGIVGWPVPEARAFIRDLTEHATRPQFTYAHRWRVNDLVMWDNRTTMHRARRYHDLRDVRDLRRTSIKGTGQTAEQFSPMVAERAAAE